MKKIIASLVLSLLVVGLLFISRGKFDKPLIPVVVGPKWVNQAQFAGMFAAQERGFYSDNGLDVSFKEFDFETNQLEDLKASKIDFAIISAEEFLLAIDQGSDIIAIAAVYQISPYAIVSLPEKEISSPADFKDLTLGVKGGKVEEYLFYELLLASVGLTEEDAEIKSTGFDNSEAEDLTLGEVDTIDVYRTDQLFFFNKEGIEYTILLPERFGVNTFNDVIVVREEFIEEQPEVIRSFLKATGKGWDYALENRELAVNDTLKYVTTDSYDDFDYQLFILNESASLVKPNSDTVIGSMSFFQWNSLYNQMVLQGFLEEGLDVNTVFTTKFLP